MSVLAEVGRTLAVVGRVIPFSPVTYDDAHDLRGATMTPRVSMDSAMGLPAAYACTVVVAEDIAKQPLQVLERSGESRREATNHPLYDLLHDQFNEEMTAIEGREWMTAIALNRGWAYAEKVPGPRGLVDQIVPLHPDRILRERVRPNVYRWRYDDPETGTRYLTRDELFILRGRFGVGVVEVMRQAFATMLARQGFELEMVQRGIRSPGALTTPKTLPDDARARIRKAIDQYMGGGERAGRPLLLEEGMEWKTIALSMEDAQFLESVQHSVADVCRAYRVPQHKVQELLRSTNNNIEQQSVDYVVDSVLGWAIRWEQAIRRDLIVAQARYFAKHNLEGLLRGDTKTRFEAYAIAVTLGWLTRAEVREKEDLDPLDDGWGLDEPLVPLNMGGAADATVSIGGQRYGAVVSKPTSPAVSSYLRSLVQDGAARLVRTEASELRKVARKGDWEAGVVAFYDAHAETVARVLRIPAESAQAYCRDRASARAVAGPKADQVDDVEAISALTSLALTQADILEGAAA